MEKKLLGNNDDDYGPVFEMPALWKQTANYFRRKVVSHKYWCQSLCQTQNFWRSTADMTEKTKLVSLLAAKIKCKITYAFFS